MPLLFLLPPPFFVIPAEAGIYKILDSRLRGNDMRKSFIEKSTEVRYGGTV